ncbi:MAG: universal stress protein [Ardenticatenaceae bacterium]|nr:universal stress protein [Ardenticatenaceae bacterium]
MLRKILVPLDGSDLAEQAISTAVEIAKKAKADIVFLKVLETEEILVPDYLAMPMPLPSQWVEDQLKNAEEYLNNAVNFYGQPGVTISTTIIEGDPAGVILDTSAEQEFDMIIMSSHGYSGLQRWILGSVTEKVLRHAVCPVLVIRSPEPAENILVALDGSTMSEEVLEMSFKLARMLNLKVYLLRSEPGLIIQNMTEIEQIERLDPGMGRRIVEELYHRSEHYLEEVKIRFDSADLEVKIIPTEGEAAGEILRFGKKIDNTIIAMATHGRDGLRRWMYGSVTEKVLRHSNRNMLVVRPSEELLAE